MTNTLKKSFLRFTVACMSLAFTAPAALSQTIRIPFIMGAAATAEQVFDFGEVQVGQYVTTTFQYKNSTGTPLAVIDSVADGVDLIGSDCPSLMQAQSTCNVTIGFLVTSEGYNQGAVKISTDKGTLPDILTVKANGVTSGQILTIFPSTKQYSTLNQEEQFTITNNKPYDVTISNIMPSNNYWSVSNNNCVGKLAAGASCKATAKYINKKTGSYSATLKIVSQSVTVGSSALSGNTALGVATFASNDITAQDLKVNQVYADSVVLKNTGAGPMTISNVSLDLPSPYFTITSNNCTGVTLVPQDTCSVDFKIVFSAPSLLQRAFIFTLNNSATSSASLNVFASAVATTAMLTVSPPLITFSDLSVGDFAAAQSIVIKSVGNSPVTVSNIGLTGDSSLFNITNKSDCIGTLSPGQQCTLNVLYGGATKPSNNSANISFNSNATTPVPSVPLKGNSIAPVLTVNPTTITFSGNVGTDYIQLITVTNTSTVPTTLKSLTSNNSNLLLTGGTCAANSIIASGSSCSIKVTLTKATAAGSGSGNISITHSGNSLTVPASYTLLPLKIDPIVSEINCPTVSASTLSATISTTKGLDSCTFSVTNPSKTAPLYIPKGGISKDSTSNAVFNAAADEVGSAITIAPNSTVTFNIGHQVPTAAGIFSGAYNIRSTPLLNDESLTSSIQKSATFSVLPPAFEFTHFSCGASAPLGGSVMCLVQITNKSASKYSMVQPFSPKKSVYIAAKFSESKLNGALVSSQFTEKPSDDLSPGATQFKWTYQILSCSSSSSSAVVGIAANDYCTGTIYFSPTKVGNYDIPVYLVPGIGPVVKSSANAVFSITELAAGNLSAVTCPSLLMGSKGVCTATLTNPATTTSLKINSITVPPTSDGVFGAPSSNCSGSLAAKSSCTISIPVIGNAVGTFTNTLKVSTSAGEHSSVASISVLTANPAVSLSAFICPSFTAGSTVDSVCSATLKNTGLVPFSITGAIATNSSLGFGSIVIKDSTVAAGSTTTLTMTFKNNTVGNYSTSVIISSNGYKDISTTANVRVLPAPLAVGVLSPLNCSPVYFGQSGLCVATLQNTSTYGALTIKSVTVSDSGRGFIGTYSSNCGTSLAANTNCTFTVPFTAVQAIPAGLTAPRVAISVLTEKSALIQRADLNIIPLTFSIVPPKAGAGIINTIVTATTTVSNKNSFDVALPASAIKIAGGIKLVSSTCADTTLKPEQSCTVTTSATASTNTVVKGQILLNYGGASMTADSVTTFTVPTLNINPLGPLTTAQGIRSLSGNWYVLSNPNPVPMTIGSIAMQSNISVAVADKSIPGSCYNSKILAAGESCNIFERFLIGTIAPVTNTGIVKTSNSTTASWKSTWTTFKGKALSDDTIMYTYPGGVYKGVVKFTNTGLNSVKNVTLIRTDVPAQNGTVFNVTDSTCNGFISPNSTCAINFEVSNIKLGLNTIPMDILGTYPTIVNNKLTGDWGEQTSIASVSSARITGVAPTATIAAGSYGNSSIATSKFTNTSAYPVYVTAVDVTGAADQYLSGTTCLNSWVAPKAMCDITTTRQLQTGDLSIVRTPAKITVTVFEKYPFFTNLTISPVMTNAVNFGRVNVNTSSTKFIPLYNGGSSPWTVSSVVLPASVKRVSSAATDCSTAASFTLAPGQKCDMRLSWSPEDEGVFDDVMKINSNWTGTPVINVNLSGVGVIPVGTVINSNAGCSGDEIVYDSVHGQIVTGMSSGSTTAGTYVNGYVLPSQYLSTALLGSSYNFSQVFGYAVGAPETSIKVGGTAQCYVFSVNPNNQYNLAADDANSVKATSSYKQNVYSAEFDGYVRITQHQGTNVSSNGLSYITPPIKYMLSFKPRGSAAPVVFFNKIEPFATKGSYYSAMKLMVNNDQTVIYVSYRDGSDIFKMYRFNLNSNNGLSEIYATPYFVAGSEPSSGSTQTAKGVVTYAFLFGGIIDPRNSDIIWGTGPNSLITYNVRTGAITKIKDNNGNLITVPAHHAMDANGVIYYSFRRDGNSETTIHAFDTNTKTFKTLATFPRKPWAGTVATINKLIVSKDNRYLYLIGQGYWSKIKINE